MQKKRHLREEFQMFLTVLVPITLVGCFATNVYVCVGSFVLFLSILKVLLKYGAEE